ncbi:MAG: hypothetical protein WCG08_05150 [Paludibacter sp.]|jgi:hypothetical protein
MYKIKLLTITLSILFFAQLVQSQNNTNSPYTRFGYGDISDTNNGEQRAMGGVSIGSRLNTGINSVNPASYSSVDSMTFMFDLGVAGMMSHFSDSRGAVTKANGNLEYLSLQFPVTKWLGFSAGALPYSFVGYDFYNTGTTITINQPKNDTISNTKSFNGSGGFSQVYMGLSANLFNHVSLGVNGYYMFGTINNSRDVSYSATSGFTSTTEYNTLKANNFRYRLGAQFYNTFAKKHDVTLGVIFEPKAKLNGNFKKTLSGILVEPTDSSSSFETPGIYGLGLYYTFDKKLSIGIDYSIQQWKDAQFSGKTDSLGNRSKISIGVDYMPNPISRKYSDHVHYRAGFNLSDSYFNVNGQQLPKNYGFSVGVGLPLKNSSTVLNASLEYGKIGSTSLLNEEYYKLTFNFTFNEHWFFKRKL